MGNRAEQCGEILRALALDSERASNDPEIAAHLETCESCRGAGRAYRRMWNLLDAHRSIAPSSEFMPSLLAKVRRSKRWNVRTALTSFAAAAALLVAVLLPLTTIERDRPGSIDRNPKPETGLTPEDEEIVANLELIEHLELAQLLDVVEDESTLKNLMMLERIAPRDDGR